MPLLAPIAPRFARLAPPGTRLIVAVSGGPDSQALLDLAGRLRATLGWTAVWAVGIDHGLRTAAASELALARALAERHGVPFITVPIEVPRGGNLAAQARAARYRALAEVARHQGADRIALGHTESDQAETVLLHLARGAATRGLSGMRWRRGRLIRPLLGTSRAEILAYLAARAVRWAEDPSNADLTRARPFVRHELLPRLRRLNGAVERTLARAARELAADERWIDGLAEGELVRRLAPAGSLALEGFAALPAPVARRLLRRWARRHRLPTDAARLRRWRAGLLDGTLRETLAGATIACDRGRLWCDRPGDLDDALAPGDRLALSPWPAHLCATVRERPPGEPLPPRRGLTPNAAVDFDLDHLHLQLRVRAWQPGDALRPFGLGGHAKVGDVFTNAKIPRALRSSWPVVVHGDEVMWVVGLCRSGAAPITPETRRVLSLVVDGALPWPP